MIGEVWLIVWNRYGLDQATCGRRGRKDRFGENQRGTKLLGAERPAESGWTAVFENAEERILPTLLENRREKKVARPRND